LYMRGGLQKPCIENFSLSGLMSDKEVAEFLKVLPCKHVSNPPLRSIKYIDEAKLRNPKDRRRLPDQILGECEIDDEQAFADIRIYRQKKIGNDILYDFKFSILHEVGHVVFWFLHESSRKKWYSLYGQTPIIWNEAGRVPEEHFCDTYAYFIMTPILVEKRFELEYKYMLDEVFCRGRYD